MGGGTKYGRVGRGDWGRYKVGWVGGYRGRYKVGVGRGRMG